MVKLPGMPAKQWNIEGWVLPHGVSIGLESNPPITMEIVKITRQAECIIFDTMADFRKKALPSSIIIVGANKLVRVPRMAFAGSRQMNL